MTIMEHELTAAGLKMNCYRGPDQLPAIIQEAILFDLMSTGGESADTKPDVVRFNHELSNCDFLVIASDLESGRLRAILGMMVPSLNRWDEIASDTERHDDQDELANHLELKVAYVAPAFRGQGIMKRMIALALLRLACFGNVPKVVYTRTANPVCYRLLQQLSSNFSGSVFFPDHDSPCIRLASVRLAQRIVRHAAPHLRFASSIGALRGGNTMAASGTAWPSCRDPSLQALFGRHLQPSDQLVVTIDLRAQTESTILSNAKRVYRTRKSGSAIASSGEAVDAPSSPARIQRSR
jgi:GNAT superfamily N-acetyltransferase